MNAAKRNTPKNSGGFLIATKNIIRVSNANSIAKGASR
jgi:hypothetical protein